jgi:serine/threonine protein kinase
VVRCLDHGFSKGVFFLVLEFAKSFEEAGLTGGTRTGDVAGTWEFMCRNQVIGYKTAGPEVDVWALAASLCTMLTGHLPRDFPDGRDPWLVVLEDDPVPILKRAPNLPRPLADLIDHVLQEEPAMPFQSAAEFRLALEEVV